MPQWSDGTVFANGANLHYYRTGGDKPALVLLHGFTDNGLCWAPLAQVLEPEYDIIMIDAPGHGRSDLPAAGFTIELLVSDVLEVLHTLALGQVTLLGHSMGAHVAARLTESNPDVVHALLLEDPPWTAQDVPPVSHEDDRGMELWKGQLLEFQKLSPEERIEEAVDFHPLWSQEDAIPWAEAQAQFQLEIFSEGIAHLTNDWQAIVTQLTRPTLLLTGDPARGSIVTPEIAQQAMQSWSDGTLVHIAGAGHSIRREQYNAYITAVRTFLKEK
jgi:N-formylmaleamate deformylase